MTEEKSGATAYHLFLILILLLLSEDVLLAVQNLFNLRVQKKNLAQ